MCCVEVIKDNIIAVQTESANNKMAIDKAIDTYLDMILYLQEDIRSLNKSIAELHEQLNSYFSQLTKEDYNQIINIYKKLVANLVQLYSTYKKSNFYSGIKTDLKEFRNRIYDLQEIGNDMKVFVVDLPQNKDYRNLMDIINSL